MVLDNSGLELYTDLLLADYLLVSHGVTASSLPRNFWKTCLEGTQVDLLLADYLVVSHGGTASCNFGSICQTLKLHN